jgi:hypothetical protein
MRLIEYPKESKGFVDLEKCKWRGEVYKIKSPDWVKSDG